MITPCQHHWLIGESCGNSNRQGVCKLCGAHKTFNEYSDVIAGRERLFVAKAKIGRDSTIQYVNSRRVTKYEA